ncbi:MAG TPA: endonuclease III [Bacteroidales bacterium]|jgi:endonuclease-3|nr:endonuclease III [Bacteroidales bacterium]HOU98831.1 endonuclease III [Bacteroidales bacterium]
MKQSKQQLYKNVFEAFKKNNPLPKTELRYQSPFQLLVAVVLSAQCTDVRVNAITPALFKKYKTPSEMALASEAEIFEYIKSCSYPNSKTKYLLAIAKKLTEKFNEKVPDTLEELTSLPGVGRKTANVILSVLFHKPAMAVDTHVFRVANRIGLVSNAKTPLEVEKQLTEHISPGDLPDAHHWLILHGRYVCKARTPMCNECCISDYCKYFNSIRK